MQSQCSGLTLRNNGAQVVGGQGAKSAVKSHRPHKHTRRMEFFCRNHETVCPPYRNVECRPVRVMPFPVIGDCRVFPPWRSSIERLQGLDLSITASGLFSTESPSNLSHGEYKTNNKSKKQHSKYLRTIMNVTLRHLVAKQAKTHVLREMLYMLTKVYAHHHQPHQATTL